VNGTRLNEWLAALATANLTTLDGKVFCDNCNIEFMEFLGNGTCVHNRTKNQPDFPSTTPAGADVFQNTTGSNATNAKNSTQDVPIPRFVGCGEGGIGLDINDNSSEYNCSCGPSCVADNSCCGDFHEECEEKCAPSEASRCWAVAMHSIQSNLQTQELAEQCLALLSTLLAPASFPPLPPPRNARCAAAAACASWLLTSHSTPALLPSEGSRELWLRLFGLRRRVHGLRRPALQRDEEEEREGQEECGGWLWVQRWELW